MRGKFNDHQRHWTDAIMLLLCYNFFLHNHSNFSSFFDWCLYKVIIYIFKRRRHQPIISFFSFHFIHQSITKFIEYQTANFKSVECIILIGVHNKFNAYILFIHFWRWTMRITCQFKIKNSKDLTNLQLVRLWASFCKRIIRDNNCLCDLNGLITTFEVMGFAYHLQTLKQTQKIFNTNPGFTVLVW